MEKDGSWAGDDFIFPTAAFLQCEIHVYIYSTKASSDPLIYSPLVVTEDHPICLAYYLPGHYNTVYNIKLPLQSSSNLKTENGQSPA